VHGSTVLSNNACEWRGSLKDNSFFVWTVHVEESLLLHPIMLPSFWSTSTIFTADDAGHAYPTMGTNYQNSWAVHEMGEMGPAAINMIRILQYFYHVLTITFAPLFDLIWCKFHVSYALYYHYAWDDMTGFHQNPVRHNIADLVDHSKPSYMCGPFISTVIGLLLTKVCIRTTGSEFCFFSPLD
jgi:hypothetical protein